MGSLEILYTLGGLAALLIAGDLARRFLLHRQNSLKVRLEPVPYVPGSEEPVNAELIGPARVVVRDYQETVFSPEPVSQDLKSPVESFYGEPVVPVYDVSNSGAQESPLGAVMANVAEVSPVVDLTTTEDLPVLELADESSAVRFAGEQQDLFASEEPVMPPPRRSRGRVQATTSAGPVLAESSEILRKESEEKAAGKPADVSDVIVMHVLPASIPFQGESLLRAVLSYGLRYGDMSIFHRHEHPAGRGDVLFSMANAVEPGTFVLDAMPDDESYGVTFFMGMPGRNSIHAYDVMLDTARRLSQELGGVLLDQQRIPLTPQLAEHYRERVQEFERQRLMGRNAVHS